jgi:hypothetical protein
VSHKPLGLLILAVGAVVSGPACRRTPAGVPTPPIPPAAPLVAPAAPPTFAPPSAAPALAGGPGDPCALICRRSMDLKCSHGAGCGESCRQMMAIGDCRAQMIDVLHCFAGEPAAHWECNEEGEAAIKDGYCDAEQGRFVRCTEHASANKPSSI